MNICELDCMCQDCIIKHRKHGCNYGAGSHYAEENIEDCDCPEADTRDISVEQRIREIWG